MVDAPRVDQELQEPVHLDQQDLVDLRVGPALALPLAHSLQPFLDGARLGVEALEVLLARDAPDGLPFVEAVVHEGGDVGRLAAGVAALGEVFLDPLLGVGVEAVDGDVVQIRAFLSFQKGRVSRFKTAGNVPTLTKYGFAPAPLFNIYNCIRKKPVSSGLFLKRFFTQKGCYLCLFKIGERTSVSLSSSIFRFFRFLADSSM